MNKMVKGSVAGAAGIALLMGGFGTYALWQDHIDTPGSTVTSGSLDIAATAPVWDNANTAAPDDWTADQDLMVPGDKITRTQEFTLTGTGKRLTGTVTLGGADISKTGGTTTDQDALDVSVVVTSGDSTKIVPVSGTNNFTFSAPFNTVGLTAVVTYELPEDVTAQIGQQVAASVAASTITIQQTSPQS